MNIITGFHASYETKIFYTLPSLEGGFITLPLDGLRLLLQFIELVLDEVISINLESVQYLFSFGQFLQRCMINIFVLHGNGLGLVLMKVNDSIIFLYSISYFCFLLTWLAKMLT